MSKINIKNIVKYYLIIFLIIIVLFLLNGLIPQKSVEIKSKESISYLNKELYITKSNNSYPEYLEYDDGDLRYMEMVLLFDNKHPVKSTIEMNSYLNGYLYKDNVKDLKYRDYSRYWHGPIIYLRIISMFMNIQTFYKIQLILLIVVSSILFLKLYRENKILAFSFLIVFYLFSIYSVYRNISYFNCIIISFISTLIMIGMCNKNKYESIPLLFSIVGLITSFFDFLTLELLTFSFPIMIYLIIYNKKSKLTIKNIINLFIIWFISYIIPFFIKWFIDYIYLGKDVIINIIKLGYYESFEGLKLIDLFKVIYFNNHLILPFYNYNVDVLSIGLFIFFLLSLLNYSDREWSIKLIVIIILCIIRIYIIPMQSIRYTFTTFRHLIPIWICIIYIIFKQIINIINNVKVKYRK